jgi:hypothetical protein
MNNEQIAALVAHYQELDEWEIADLYARASSLTEEGRQALATVISQRKVDVQSIHEQGVTEERTLLEQERIRELKRKARDARWFRIMLVVTIPLIALSALLRPEKTWETLVSSLVQALGVTAIALVFLKLRRAFEGKKK